MRKSINFARIPPSSAGVSVYFCPFPYLLPKMLFTIVNWRLFLSSKCDQIAYKKYFFTYFWEIKRKKVPKKLNWPTASFPSPRPIWPEATHHPWHNFVSVLLFLFLPKFLFSSIPQFHYLSVFLPFNIFYFPLKLN
jgi:hypothetical protein